MKTKLLTAIFFIPCFALMSQTTLYTNNFTSGGGDFTLGQGNNFDFWIVNSVYTCSSTTANQGGGNYMHIYDDLGGDYCAHSGFYGFGSGGTVYATKKVGVNTTGHPVVTINFDWLCNGQTGSVLPSFGFVDYSINNGGTWTNITQPRAKYDGQSTWASITISSAQVPALLNQTTLLIRFGFTNSGYGTNPAFAIDNLTIIGSTSTNVMESAANNHSLSIYPNPFTGSANITLNNANDNSQSLITVYDIFGREVKHVNISGKNAILTQGDLQAGIYFVRVADADGNVSAIQKIIIE